MQCNFMIEWTVSNEFYFHYYVILSREQFILKVNVKIRFAESFLGFWLYFKPEWTLHQYFFIACTGLKIFKYGTLFSIRLQKNIDCSMLVVMYFRFRVTKHDYYTGQYFS